MGELMIDHISFSQLTMAEECPYAWFLLKMTGVQPVENGFSQSGTLVHSLLAAWARGEEKASDLPLRWVERFPKEVTAPFPPYLKAKGYVSKLFESVLSYFETFDGFPGFDVIGVEKQFVSSLAGEKFVGIVDLILRDQKTGGLTLVDHKSCSMSSFRKTKDMKYRQLLLYSKHCADTYGMFPERLCFNLFKEHSLDERPFTPQDYMEARNWAEQQVEAMKSRELTDWFETRPEMFRCTALCSCRNECPYGSPENHKKKENRNEREPITAVA